MIREERGNNGTSHNLFLFFGFTLAIKKKSGALEVLLQHLKLKGDLFTKECKPYEGRRTNSLQVVNDTDTTVNVIDPQTNQTVATVPGKIVKVAFTPEGEPLAVTLSTVSLLALNGTTGYAIL